MSDSEILDLIDDLIAQSDPARRMRFADRYQLKTELFNSVRRLDILQELLDDDTVTEIMVNGMGSIYIERAGRLMKWEKAFTSREKLQDIIQAIVAYSNRVANESVPIVDARLQRGERVNIVMNPIAIDGPVVTIRRFPEKPISIRQLISWGSVSQEEGKIRRRNFDPSKTRQPRAFLNSVSFHIVKYFSQADVRNKKVFFRNGVVVLSQKAKRPWKKASGFRDKSPLPNCPTCAKAGVKSPAGKRVLFRTRVSERQRGRRSARDCGTTRRMKYAKPTAKRRNNV